MPKKLCPKIILEGTRLTFKTEIAFTLNEHPSIVGPRKYRYHSPLISAESFETARNERLKVSGNPVQYTNINTFIDQQKLFREIISKSIIPILEVDISDNNVIRAADAIADWLSANGGLYATENDTQSQQIKTG